MNWHKRFLQQAGWTRTLRSYLFDRAGLLTARRVLEVGCGTGAVLTDISTSSALVGVDNDLERLIQAKHHASAAILACADGQMLPFATGVMDITFCHYLLLWVHDPLRALREMKRVTRPGGAVLALAEPDHTARVDRPASLASLGRFQTESLRLQGADPSLGARLEDLFHQAGIQTIETGTIQGDGFQTLDENEWILEWDVLEADLEALLPRERILEFKALDKDAKKGGKRILHVPTYFAYGVV